MKHIKHHPLNDKAQKLSKDMKKQDLIKPKKDKKLPLEDSLSDPIVSKRVSKPSTKKKLSSEKHLSDAGGKIKKFNENAEPWKEGDIIKNIVDIFEIELEDNKDFDVVRIDGLLLPGTLMIKIDQDFSNSEYFYRDIDYKTSLGGIDSEKLELNQKQYEDLIEFNSKLILNIAKKYDWLISDYKINTFKNKDKEVCCYFYIDNVLNKINESNDYVNYKYSQGELVEIFKINLEDNNQFELLDVEDDSYFNIIRFATDTTLIKLTEDFSQNEDIRTIWEHTNDSDEDLQEILYIINAKITNVIARKYDFILEKVKLNYIDYVKFTVEFDIFIKQNKQ